MRQEENSLKGPETLQKIVPYQPYYGVRWKGLEAVRYRTSSATGVEFTLPPVSYHCLVLISRPPEKLRMLCAGVKRDMPPAAGSIAVMPAGSSQLVRWQGSKDTLHVYLEPSLVARVAAESFEFDRGRTVLPPLHGLNVPELRSAMLAVDAELRAGGGGGELLAESFANVLAVYLIRHVTGSRRELVAADGVLPRHKLRRVIEYIVENLEGSPTLEQMAAIVHLSPYHFARQFKAATGLAPHQYVISRRVERAQHLLRTNGRLGVGEVALRSGFAHQSHFGFHFKRIVGMTPRQFVGSARIP
jgi:AraC family transcriptional regulator